MSRGGMSQEQITLMTRRIPQWHILTWMDC